jgi:hypothetical protein
VECPPRRVRPQRRGFSGTIVGMRLSEWLWAESESRAGGLPVTVDRTLADDPATGHEEPEASRGLAGRRARLPAAHPSAWPDAVCDTAVRGTSAWGSVARHSAVSSTADSADRGPRGDRADEDAWWRGESDIWWRVPDRSAGDEDCEDDLRGVDDLSELADGDDEAGDPVGTGDPGQDGGLGEADATGETDGQGGGPGERPARTARRTQGPAGRDLGHMDGRWGEVGGPRAGPDYGSYRPWFSPGVPGDPWFAAGLEYPAGG